LDHWWVTAGPNHGSGSNQRTELKLVVRNQNRLASPVLQYQTEPELGWCWTGFGFPCSELEPSVPVREPTVPVLNPFFVGHWPAGPIGLAHTLLFFSLAHVGFWTLSLVPAWPASGLIFFNFWVAALKGPIFGQLASNGQFLGHWGEVFFNFLSLKIRFFLIDFVIYK